MVKLELFDELGKKRIVWLLGRGDVLGLESLVNKSYRHTAVVLEPGDFCQIPVDVIENIKKHSSSLCEGLLTRWDKAVTQADEWFVNLQTGPGKQRVMKLLSHLAENSGDKSERGVYSAFR